MVVSLVTITARPFTTTSREVEQEVKQETPKKPATAVIIYSSILQISLNNSLFIIKIIILKFKCLISNANITLSKHNGHYDYKI